MKLCILFPGIGYHCDKPLLYYAAKLARSKGYEVKALKYSGFDTSVKDNEDKMRNAAKLALSQSKAQLADIDLSVYDTSALRSVCQQKNVPLCEYDEANHSLETGDVMTDLKYLRDVIEKIERLL